MPVFVKKVLEEQLTFDELDAKKLLIQILREDEILTDLLIQSARMGAQIAMDKLISLNLKDAAKQIGITPKTLTKRILQGKIKAVDNRISAAEIQRYLAT